MNFMLEIFSFITIIYSCVHLGKKFGSETNTNINVINSLKNIMMIIFLISLVILSGIVFWSGYKWKYEVPKMDEQYTKENLKESVQEIYKELYSEPENEITANVNHKSKRVYFQKCTDKQPIGIIRSLYREYEATWDSLLTRFIHFIMGDSGKKFSMFNNIIPENVKEFINKEYKEYEKHGFDSAIKKLNKVREKFDLNKKTEQTEENSNQSTFFNKFKNLKQSIIPEKLPPFGVPNTVLPTDINLPILEQNKANPNLPDTDYNELNPSILPTTVRNPLLDATENINK